MEKEIWVAVLERAEQDARGRRVNGEPGDSLRRSRLAVSRWLGSEDFDTVCDLAGADRAVWARKIRAALERGGPLKLPDDDRFADVDPIVAREILGTCLDRPHHITTLKGKRAHEAMPWIKSVLDKREERDARG